jgi:CRISPR-associated endonuclease/helicase Cas3
MPALDRVWAKSRARPGDTHGELLTAHLTAAREAGRALRSRTGRIPCVPDRFWDWVEVALLLHDAGKIPDGFQQMVGNHGPQVPWRQRHEVYSLGFAAHLLSGRAAGDLDWIQLGIATHHRALDGETGQHLRWFLNGSYATPGRLSSAIGPVDPRVIADLYQWLAAGIGQPAGAPPDADDLASAAHAALSALVGQWADQYEPDPARDLTGVLLQGAVTLADHAASAHREFLLRQPLAGGYRGIVGKTLYPHQEQAAGVDGHLLLRAPTGQGKTEAALLWAARQVTGLQERTGGIPRVFYTLPYLASINAMTGRLRKDLDPDDEDLVGVAHSKAASYYLKAALNGDCPPDEATAAQQAVVRSQSTRLFREPVRVGTPYQLLRGALAGPAHAGILIDSANSVFILDELHAYEPVRLGMILAMMRLWARLGGRIGVVSATLPGVLARLIAEAIGDEPQVVEPPDSWAWPVRHRLELRPDHLTSAASIAEITAELRAGKSVLVVANNVADARGLFEALAPVVMHENALLLHSRFRAGDRAGIEEQILARFEAGKPRLPGLLVATQTVEVSLNVDFDVLHTSGAPLESLIQRFGRVNRLTALPAPAPVIVHQPAYGPRRGQPHSDYADGVYDAGPVRLAWQILQRHEGRELDEQTFGEWLDEVYASDWGQRWRAQADASFQRWTDRFVSFELPFDDRSHLEGEFEQLFDGTEAILERDVGTYRERLADASRAAGRLLAADLLIPVPAYGTRCGRWDKDLGVTVIDAEYDDALGLGKIRGRDSSRYLTGEVL